MSKVVGIRFKPAGKIYDFDCGVFVLNPDDNVIVSTEEGLSFGCVATPPLPVDESLFKNRLKKVFRIANEDDIRQRDANLEIEKKAYDYSIKCIKDLHLEMNLFSVESNFEANKLTFYFTAEGRVDFRELVKQLVKEFRIRIEMRQVGIRNQAKMCGGLGRCGREICCSAYMEKFEPVSIRMAKVQNLSLNPTKISGQCGRLMCCLTFENETYRFLKEGLPKIGATVNTPRGQGKVLRHNVIRSRVTVQLEDGMEVEVQLDEILDGKKESPH